MSGTSLDGLDIAYSIFEQKKDQWTFTIQQTQSVDYSATFKEKLKNTVHLDAPKLLEFHNQYGSWLGTQAKAFIDKHNILVDFIASHGHTVFHQPKIGLTYQIGSGQHLANASQQKVICDFRTNDVALGGQGAPLVPIGDKLLFGNHDYCLNLGGISNISFEQEGKRIAYDISPVNMLLNHICKKINLEYDHGGDIAAKGKLNTVLFDQLNTLPYYKAPHPKSLGYEWFESSVTPIIENTKDTIENLLHTSVHHIAFQIAKAIENIKKQHANVLVTGGGAKNTFLMDIFHKKTSEHTKIIIPSTEIIDFKEALIFAFMGVLRDQNNVNCLQSVTGALKDSSSGVVFHPSL